MQVPTTAAETSLDVGVTICPRDFTPLNGASENGVIQAATVLPIYVLPAPLRSQPLSLVKEHAPKIVYILLSLIPALVVG